MWKRRRTWLVLAALSCVALAVYFEPTPKILWVTPDTAPVLEELAREEKYCLLTTIALRRVEQYKITEAKVAQEMGGGPR